MVFFVYILRCKDNSLYTGVAKDIEKRIKQHSSGKGSKYVFSRHPVKLVHKEKFLSLSEALKREAEIKKMSRKEKEKLIK